jgi:hypothetical protein
LAEAVACFLALVALWATFFAAGADFAVAVFLAGVFGANVLLTELSSRLDGYTLCSRGRKSAAAFWSPRIVAALPSPAQTTFFGGGAGKKCGAYRPRETSGG